MKTIGLLGGMSWESTQTYYRLINQGVRQIIGGHHSAQIAMYSVDFAPVERLQHSGDWAGTAQLLIEASQRIQAAGAECLVIATNTMHKIAPQIEAAIDIPLLHIVDATGNALAKQGIQCAGLLGTAFTMEEPFFLERLTQNFGIQVSVPPPQDRAIVHQVIYQELCQGQLREESKATYLRIVQDLAEGGADAVILGCTEIGLLINQADTGIKLLDTTALHAQMAVEFALSH